MVVQLPVNFVTNGEITYGFSEIIKNATTGEIISGGDLVAVFDNFGNQAAIAYEDGRIARVVDSEEKEIKLEYHGSVLKTITDFQDRKTSFEYSNEMLVKIVYANGQKSTFKYSNGKLSEAISPSGIGARVEYGNSKVRSVAKVTYSLGNISANETEETTLAAAASDEILYNISYSGSQRKTTVMDPNGNKVIYHFNNDDEIIAEHSSSKKHGSAVYTPTKVLLYASQKDEFQLAIEKIRPSLITEAAAESIVTAFKNNNTPWTWANVQAGYPSTEFASVFNEIEQGNVVVGFQSKSLRTNKDGQVSVQERKEFKYDDRDNLIEETVFEEKIVNNDAPANRKMVTLYEYNKQGKPIRVIDYQGVVSETQYDARGNVTKTVKYHKSNPSAKFYQEKEVAENGQVKTELDELGEASTKFQYVNGTNRVSSVIDSSGHKTSFGYDAHTDETLGVSTTVDGEVNETIYKFTTDFLTKLTSGNAEVEYTYDKWGRKESIIVNGREHVKFEYPNNQRVITKYMNGTTNSNGDHFETITDKAGKVISVHHKKKQSNFWAKILENEYDSENRLVKTIDYATQEVTTIAYDGDGNVTKTMQGDMTITPHVSLDGNTKDVSYKIGNRTAQVYSENSKDGELKNLVLPTGDVVELEHDGIGRLTKVTAPVVAEEFGYLQSGDHASTTVSRITQKIGSVTKRTRYAYDSKGNITEIRDGFNRLQSKYEYDGLNRLIRENDTEFGYDNNGNILFKKTGNEVTKYEYSGDQLISFNGESCGSYDVLGNPMVYRDKAVKWDFRNLMLFGDAKFEYGSNGLRKKKTHGYDRSEYFWADDKLIAEKRIKSKCDFEVGGYIYDGGHHVYADETFIEYVYGVNGITGFKLNDTPYWFVKNLQGDVTSIHDGSGACVAEYEYDAWGNHKITSSVSGIAELNAIRYGLHDERRRATHARRVLRGNDLGGIQGFRIRPQVP